MSNMKSAIFSATLAVALAFGATTLMASPSEAKGNKAGWTEMKPFEEIDKNHDGAVTPDEFKAALAGSPMAKNSGKLFKRIDKNNNGKIEKAEFDTWVANAKSRRDNRGNKNANKNAKPAPSPSAGT